MSRRVEADRVLLGTRLLQAFFKVVSLAVLSVFGYFDGDRPRELLLGRLNVHRRCRRRGKAAKAERRERGHGWA